MIRMSSFAPPPIQDHFRTHLDASVAVRDRIRAVVADIYSVARIMHSSILLVHCCLSVPDVLDKYVATLREQLEQLETKATSEGATRISKAKLNVYSEKIEALATSFATELVPPPEAVEVAKSVSNEETPNKEQEYYKESHSPGLRRRHGPQMRDEGQTGEITETQHSPPVKLDHSAHVHIDKHRKLQEDLTDEMVVLARQLKETSLIMSQSVKNTEKVLDSTENAVEHSLASTGRANVRAAEIYSQSVKTSCFTWLLMFFMIGVFVMVVLLIRIT